MKRIYAFWLLLSLFVAAHSQVPIRGTVTRQANGKPLPGASVYIEHTSIGTVTDSTGAFLLTIPTQAINSPRLVVSYIGFQTHVENITAGNRHPFAIALAAKTTNLQEVVVMAHSKNGWRKWGQLFTDLFIGTSAFAKHCTLQNKESLRFVFARATNTLHVYATEPLILENQSLGYSIRIDLENFTYDFNKKYLFYEIHSFYRPLPAEDASDIKKWKRNRADMYAGSPMHFFRTLYDSSYEKQGFEIRRLIASDNEPVATIGPDPVHFYEFASIKDSLTVLLNFRGRLSVRYIKKNAPHEYLLYTGIVAPPGQPPRSTTPFLLQPASTIELTENIPVEVYKNGAVKNDDLLVDGYFSWWNKMATLLPLDYEPEND